MLHISKCIEKIEYQSCVYASEMNTVLNLLFLVRVDNSNCVVSMHKEL